MKKYKLISLLFVTLLIAASFFGCTNKESKANEVYDEKPVIYLYPEEMTEVYVQLSLDGELTCTYPAYQNGWRVTAYSDGTLVNHADNKEYTSLFWEGTSCATYDMSKGFVVAGDNTADFLDEKLTYLGLTAKERNEFIMYWLPRMQENSYNLITFQDDAYTDSARLNITPQPDSILRVFMAYQPLEKAVTVEEQILAPGQRDGFTVVEWGGCELK